MRGRKWLRWVMWLIVLLLLGWMVRVVPFYKAWEIIQNLKSWQILVLIILNLLVVLLMSARWWMVLLSQGARVPFSALTGYRVAGFGISYFTPGPQLGGEPLQVYLLHNRHNVALSGAVATVTLDKLTEVMVNFSGLVAGITIMMTSGLMGSIAPGVVVPLLIAMLLLPVAYLVLVAHGKRPIAGLICTLEKYPALRKVCGVANKAEEEMASFCREKPKIMFISILTGLIILVLMVGEFWLTLGFLGLQLDLVDTIIIWSASRLGFLMPLPGGLGTLEASQLLVMQALGLDPAYGVSLSLIIRARDVLVGGFGLLLGAYWTQRGMITGGILTDEHGAD